jgi:hypothetical protein
MDEKKGKCPHCEELVTKLNVARVTLNDELWGSRDGLTFSCPLCQAVLSVSPDPAALLPEIQKTVESAIRKHLRT